MTDITEFKGMQGWLSNFSRFEKPMKYGDLVFTSNEHFYQAMKTLDKQERLAVSKHPAKGLKAFSRTLTLRDDWDGIKLEVMLYGLRYKFSNANPIHRQKLIDTGDCDISEGNYWGDKFWGVCLKTGVGENRLGSLLMKVREEIKGE